MLKLEQRHEPPVLIIWITPVLAFVLTVLSSFALFMFVGKDPLQATYLIFAAPLLSSYTLAELAVKATPLILIGTGLALGFRAGVWNIGAEGQFTIGGVCGGAIALALYEIEGVWVLPLVCLAGALGGMAWAAIPALLRTRFNTNEILVSLMLVYVASLLLSYLLHGALRDPDGQNFPESRLFHDSALLPAVIAGTRVHAGFPVALFVVVTAWIMLRFHLLGFQIDVTGRAPRAAGYAGFSTNRTVWITFMISGALAGLAGIFEAAGPVGQLLTGLPAGYGFTAIIAAFAGRLNPIGVLFAAFLLALTYVGGEEAQIGMGIASATTQVLQGLLLFFLLAGNILITYRVRLSPARSAKKS